MTSQPFHHGRLRAELLERAERVVREEGPEAVSLRELARQAGVSHAAPRRHFADRRALLDAVAERGFDRLTALLVSAAGPVDREAPARFRAAAAAYVDFAARESKLHDLMFTTKSDAAPQSLNASAWKFLSVSGQLLTAHPREGASSTERDPKALLIIAALQGLAAMIASGRLPAEAAGPVLDEAVATFFPEP